MGTISGGAFDGSSVVGWSGWSDSNDFGRPTLNVPGISYPSPSASAPQGAFSWGARVLFGPESIWSLGVRRHGGRGHRLTLAGERFVGLASEDAAAFSIFFPMD